MYTVFRWFNDEDDPYTVQLGYFTNVENAHTFMDFYALLHKISLDDLSIGHEEFSKFLDRMYRENGI